MNMECIKNLKRIPFEEILAAKNAAPKEIKNTPLVKLNTAVPGKEIYIKLENLQATGSFKVRGAYNALHKANKDILRGRGVFTSSAGNFAQGLAWTSAMLNVPCTVVTPDSTPQVKLDAIRSMGAHIIKVSSKDWWNVMLTGEYKDLNKVFIHPCCDKNVMAGNGVIGIEIIEELPDVDTIICSYGGGGHSIGIASAVKHLKVDTKVYACEAETASPLHESFQAGKPVEVSNFRTSFVDGMNGRSMFPCMWSLASNLITDSIVLSLKEICNAVKLLMIKNHIVTEGAGAATVAAALSNKTPPGKIVCVISGGNIDVEHLKSILDDHIPCVD